MSVRFEQDNDRLVVAAVPTNVGQASTGLFFGGWLKLISDRNEYSDIAGFVNGGSGSFDKYDLMASHSDVTTPLCFFSNGGAGTASASGLSTGTWYYLAITRTTGGCVKYWLFDDSASTTPLSENTVTQSGTVSGLSHFGL